MWIVRESLVQQLKIYTVLRIYQQRKTYQIVYAETEVLNLKLFSFWFFLFPYYLGTIHEIVKFFNW